MIEMATHAAMAEDRIVGREFATLAELRQFCEGFDWSGVWPVVEPTDSGGIRIAAVADAGWPVGRLERRSDGRLAFVPDDNLPDYMADPAKWPAMD